MHESRSGGGGGGTAWAGAGAGGPPVGGMVAGEAGERNGAVSPRKEAGRASLENWRSREAPEDGWRTAHRTDKWGM